MPAVWTTPSASASRTCCAATSTGTRSTCRRPGIERPLRTQAHFRNAVGSTVAVRTEHDLNGRKKFRGTVVAADNGDLALDVTNGERVKIPYAQIVRGNLVDEGH